MQNKNKFIIILITMFLFIGIIMILFSFGNESRNNNPTIDGEDNDRLDVTQNEFTEVNMYFSLEAMLNNYMLNLSNDEESILKDIVYNNETNTIKNDVLKVYNIQNIASSSEVYHEINSLKKIILNGDYDLYYVDGNYVENKLVFHTGEDNYENKKTNIYNIIIYDKINEIYSIIPVTETEFNNNEYSENELNITENNNNKLNILNITENYLVSAYFTDVRGKILEKSTELDQIIINEGYENLTINEYSEVEKYSFSTNYDKLTIIDNNKIEYIFHITDIMKYTVEITQK